MNLVSGYSKSCELAEISKPCIKALSERLIWPIELSRLSGLNMETLLSTDSENPFVINKTMPGSMRPIVSTAGGRAILSSLDKDLHDQYVRIIRTDGELSNIELAEFKAQIQDAIAVGYAEFQEDNSPDKSISVAVRSENKVIAALSAKVIASACDSAMIRHDILPALKSGAYAVATTFANSRGTREAQKCTFGLSAA